MKFTFGRRSKRKGGKKDKLTSDAVDVDKVGIKLYVWNVFENPDDYPEGAKLTIFMMLVICYSSVILAIETMPELEDVDYRVWLFSEVVCTMIFTAEYAIRLVTCPDPFPKLGFIFGAMNMIDLVAIIPFYIDLVNNAGLPDTEAEYRGEGGGGVFRVLRVVRLVRVFRVLKTGRYSNHLNVFFQTVSNSAGALVMMVVLFVLNSIFFAALIHEFEKDDNPEGFGSIMTTLWFTIITMSTVGYGDHSPQTFEGKFVTAVCMIVGMLAIALPVTVLGAQSVKEYDTMVQKKQERMLKRGEVDKDLVTTDMMDADALQRNLDGPTAGEEQDVLATIDDADVIQLTFGGSFRLAVWNFFEDPTSSLKARAWGFFMGLVIAISTATIIMQTMKHFCRCQRQHLARH